MKRRGNMEFIKKDDIVKLKTDSQESHQLLWNENSNSERVTITKVHVYPSMTNIRHKHCNSEQVWIALKGTGTLLLSDNQEKEFSEGDVVRFEDGDIHGIENRSSDEFVYISITSPPINFRYAYDKT